jgi:hypothetical protein
MSVQTKTAHSMRRTEADHEIEEQVLNLSISTYCWSPGGGEYMRPYPLEIITQYLRPSDVSNVDDRPMTVDGVLTSQFLPTCDVIPYLQDVCPMHTQVYCRSWIVGHSVACSVTQ